MTKLKKGDLVHFRRPGYFFGAGGLPAYSREHYAWGETNAIYLVLLTPEEAGVAVAAHNDERYYCFHLQNSNSLFRVEHRTDLDAALDKVNPTGSWKDLKYALRHRDIPGGTVITLLNNKD